MKSNITLIFTPASIDREQIYESSKVVYVLFTYIHRLDQLTFLFTELITIYICISLYKKYFFLVDYGRVNYFIRSKRARLSRIVNKKPISHSDPNSLKRAPL